MINLSQNGMRCRATKAIRAHQGLVRCSTKGTIQGVVDSLGRQLINVKWETGITYVFLNEIEMIESVQLARTIHAWQRSRREPSGARAQPEADPPLAEMGLCLGAARKLDVWSDHLGAM